MTRLSSARTREDGGSFFSSSEPPPLRPSPFGEGVGDAGEVRPEGVEWRSCKPRVGAIGVSSSKLSILLDLLSRSLARDFLYLRTSGSPIAAAGAAASETTFTFYCCCTLA